MNDEEIKVIEHLKKVAEERTIIPLDDEIAIVLNLIEKQKAEIENKDIALRECERNLIEERQNRIKEDKIINLMAEDKYENINMLQMANIGKKINYDPTKLFNGIPDKEAIKIIKQYFEKKAEEDK